MAGKTSERIRVFAADPITGQVNREQVRQAFLDFEGTLFQVGGKLQVTVDRVQVGEVQIGDGAEPIAETVAYVFRYQSFAPMRRPEEAHEFEPDADLAEATFEEDEAGEDEDLPSEDDQAGDPDLLSPEEIQNVLRAEAAVS